MIDLLRRLVSPVEHHWGPPGYYLLVSLIGLVPWTVLVPGCIRAAWADRRSDAVARVLLVWTVGPWLVLELVQTKLPHYILPVYPAIALMLARAVCSASGNIPEAPGTGRPFGPRALRAWFVSIAVVAVFLAGAGVLSGNRSVSATQYLLRQGYTQVANVNGGIVAWYQAGLPVTTATLEPGEGDVPG